MLDINLTPYACVAEYVRGKLSIFLEGGSCEHHNIVVLLRSRSDSIPGSSERAFEQPNAPSALDRYSFSNIAK